MKKVLVNKSILKRFFIFIILTISVFILPSCNTDVKRDPETFDDFAKQIFNLVLEGDELDLNFLIENPTDFGLEEHYEPSLPTPSSGSALGTLLLNLYFMPLKQYNYDELNTDQQMTYLVLDDLLTNINETSSMVYLKSDYLGSYLGYQAQLPILLAQYHLNDEQDILNYFEYLKQMKDTFMNYCSFEVEKADNGYGMPDFVIDKVIDQCNSFISEVRNDTKTHFLIQTFNNRIDKLDFLSEDKKAQYINDNHTYIVNDVVDAYQVIIDNIEVVRGRAVNNYGLCYYVKDEREIGKQYYESLFKKASGYDIPVSDAIVYLDNAIQTKYGRLREIVVNNASVQDEIKTVQLMDSEPRDQLDFYISEYNKYFPELNLEKLPEIDVLYVDESMEDHYSPASYMVSAIDNYSNEVIYLNNKSIHTTNDLGETVLDYNYLYTTLAHEGFPGHMYQNIYFKNLDVNPLRKILKNSGYMEGWATYVEHYSYKFIENDYSADVIELLKLNDEVSGLLQTRCDLGIHYEGWKEKEVEDFLGKYLSSYNRDSESYKEGASTRLVQQLVEIPTNSVKYFFTYLKLCDLHDWAMQQDNYDEVLFHKYILDCGPLPLRYVEEYVRDQY